MTSFPAVMKKALPSLFLAAMMCGPAALESDAQTLFGVITQNPNRGFLVSVNIATGAGTLIGDTGVTAPSGLTFNTNNRTMLVIDASGGQVSAIDVTTGAATPLQDSAPVPLPGALAFRFVDNLLYTCSPSINTCELLQLDPTTGANVGTVGIINKGPVGGLAVRPSDGVLFGAGIASGNQNFLFTSSTTQGPPPRETDIGQMDRLISALDFHPNGTLFASDGASLLTVNTTTGAVTEVGRFGANIGFVAGLAFVPGDEPVRVAGDVLSICRRFPWICNAELKFEKNVIKVTCPLRRCVVPDPVPRNCLTKYNCPGCGRGLCPPYYHLYFSGLADVWTVDLVDREGKPVPHDRFKTKDGIVLSFRPDKPHFIDGLVGDYLLVFHMRAKGKPGVEYTIGTRLERSDRPYRAKK